MCYFDYDTEAVDDAAHDVSSLKQRFFRASIGSSAFELLNISGIV